jgi:hypothetical protein
VIDDPSSDYTNSSIRLIGDRSYISSNNKREVWIYYTAYRNSKQMYQQCRVKVEFTFDALGKIKSYRELKIEDLRFVEY